MEDDGVTESSGGAATAGTGASVGGSGAVSATGSKKSKKGKKADYMRTWSGVPRNVKSALKNMDWTDDSSVA